MDNSMLWIAMDNGIQKQFPLITIYLLDILQIKYTYKSNINNTEIYCLLQ